MWNPDKFLEEVYAESAPNRSFAASTAEEWSRWRTALRARLIEAIVLPAPLKDVPEPEHLDCADCGTYVRERVQWTTGPQLAMPCYVLTPTAGKPPYPAIVACPGHGYGAKQLVGLAPDGSERKEAPGIYKDYPIELAKRGFVVIVPELLGLGDRRLLQDGEKPPDASSCFRLATNLLMAGKTLLGVRVREMMSCVDYLQARPDVSAERIGCMGFSGGGLVMAVTAAVDERIRAAVISGYTNLYRDSILAKPHCADNYIPGLLRFAEMPDLFGLIAPRPLLVQSGQRDAGFPIEGTLRAVAHLKHIYRASGKPEAIEEDLHPGKHEVGGERAYDWLSAQLAARSFSDIP